MVTAQETKPDSKSGSSKIDHEDISNLPGSELPGEKLMGPPPVVVNWDQDDKKPYNWSMTKKVYHTVLIGMFGLTVTFASSVYTPEVPEMQVFNVSETAALLPFSLFLLGLGFGPVLAAPLSEKFGRTATYMISLPLFASFVVGAGASQTFGELVACRLLAGIFGSPPLVVGAGPALGPFTGGPVVPRKGWRWTEWIILFFAFVSLAAALGMDVIAVAIASDSATMSKPASAINVSCVV
ncbi:hypothetical protein SBOR_8913 [Sclerotinia borealis F-4128]|uniref:Major facilitator superfamily (MFS) profile domain-containing protein n=1 Tax=Sclerotinia borealis (strain F-4128) TaxID=1432307 RepID=W9C755_SCLBF|nr:hypothetical protein SBOR_8913 [Sclerotinia borealis F-4128]